MHARGARNNEYRIEADASSEPTQNHNHVYGLLSSLCWPLVVGIVNYFFVGKFSSHFLVASDNSDMASGLTTCRA